MTLILLVRIIIAQRFNRSCALQLNFAICVSFHDTWDILYLFYSLLVTGINIANFLANITRQSRRRNEYVLSRQRKYFPLYMFLATKPAIKPIFRLFARKRTYSRKERFCRRPKNSARSENSFAGASNWLLKCQLLIIILTLEQNYFEICRCD